MKLTSQEEYGLRCLLRIAREGEGGSLTIPKISQKEGISNFYVAKLMRKVGVQNRIALSVHAITHSLVTK